MQQNNQTTNRAILIARIEKLIAYFEDTAAHHTAAGRMALADCAYQSAAKARRVRATIVGTPPTGTNADTMTREFS